MAKSYKKKYKDPHAKLKASLAAILALALSIKQKLILQYVADNGPDGLLDYAETILDSGWENYWHQATEILTSAAVDSSIETIDASGQDVSDEFISNIEKQNSGIAKIAAAALLGLFYDLTRDVAVPTLVGWSVGEAVAKSLETTLEKAKTEEWSSARIETVIEELSSLSPDRAESMAHNALALVDGQSARMTAGATGAMDKRSESVNDDRVCVECQQNEVDGWIGINEKFSGSLTEDTPHHYQCRCSVEYRWADKPEVALAS